MDSAPAASREPERRWTPSTTRCRCRRPARTTSRVYGGLLGCGDERLAAPHLDDIARMYSEFVTVYGALRDRVREGGATATQALLARTRIIDSWRSFPGRDPDLPPELLPGQWPRAEAHETFVEVYDALGPLAAIRVRQILGHIAPDLADLVHHHTTGSLLEIGAQAYRRHRAAVRGTGADASVPA